MAVDTAATDLPTHSTRCRKFGLTDGMILIAGAALSLSAGAPTSSCSWPACSATFSRLPPLTVTTPPMHWPAFWADVHHPLKNALWYGFQVAGTFLFGMTAAFLAVRLRRPRPICSPSFDNQAWSPAWRWFSVYSGVQDWLIILFPGKVDSMTAAPIAAGGTVVVGWVRPGPESEVGPRAGMDRPPRTDSRMCRDRDRDPRPHDFPDLKRCERATREPDPRFAGKPSGSAQDGDRHSPTMRHGAMFPEIDPLPGSQVASTLEDWQ